MPLQLSSTDSEMIKKSTTKTLPLAPNRHAEGGTTEAPSNATPISKKPPTPPVNNFCDD